MIAGGCHVHAVLCKYPHRGGVSCCYRKSSKQSEDQRCGPSTPACHSQAPGGLGFKLPDDPTGDRRNEEGIHISVSASQVKIYKQTPQEGSLTVISCMRWLKCQYQPRLVLPLAGRPAALRSAPRHAANGVGEYSG